MKKLLRYLHKKLSARMWAKAYVATKPSITISFDVEGEEDTKALPQLLTMLQKHNIKASFACVGKQIELYPEAYKQILIEGHEIINHSYSHDGKAITKEEIEKCQSVCKSILNYEPKGFRTPHFSKLHNLLIYIWLKELGMAFSSSISIAKAKTLEPYDNDGIKELPVITCPEHYFSVMDSCHLLKNGGHKPDEMLSLFQNIIAKIISNNITAVFYFDPSHIINIPEFEQCLELISKQNIPIKTCGELI